jgi:hypothetical protein
MSQNNAVYIPSDGTVLSRENPYCRKSTNKKSRRKPPHASRFLVFGLKDLEQFKDRKHYFSIENGWIQ